MKINQSRNQREGWYAGRKPWFWGYPLTRTKERSYSLNFFNFDTRPLLEGTCYDRNR